MQFPDLSIETALAQQCGGTLIAGMDEVGRGALAGPVAVGVAAVDTAVAQPLEGLRDSKKLTVLQRERMAIAIPDWAATAVGLASADEIDTYGLSAALGLAGRRAWHQLVSTIGMPQGLVLDGNTMWLNAAPHDLVRALEPVDTRVMLQTKADVTCCTVSAAAITAKVARDALMIELAERFPDYGWASNKGYGSVAHRSALNTLGVTDYHRKSWNLVPEEIQPKLL
ncbi:ribonuclease HII [Enteractinococcus fodinae]|uniref:Ribonuclease n=1 Tax=Enteractinococcus fodinae TaxID=684663 RepID=A0ABU2B000_9MICC|nr:ribonuclease HII [Enteractinococcus fodinae]MDR7346925.1 ribonuclease HII [Enteractinococcus fodinae]